MDDFREPPWDAPIDVDALVAAIPAEATITGMFPARLVKETKALGHTLAGARDRYVPFQPYPLQEHCRLLAQALPLFYPHLPPRLALRKLGRAGPKAFLDSTVGRVMLATAEGVHAAIDAMAKAYAINLSPGSAEVTERGDAHAIVRMTDVHYFLDTHHVGTFEGVLKVAGVEGRVLVRSYTATAADFRVEWSL